MVNAVIGTEPCWAAGSRELRSPDNLWDAPHALAAHRASGLVELGCSLFLKVEQDLFSGVFFFLNQEAIARTLVVTCGFLTVTLSMTAGVPPRSAAALPALGGGRDLLWLHCRYCFHLCLFYCKLTLKSAIKCHTSF